MTFGVIASRAGSASAAAIAGERTLPRLLRMLLADPTAILALKAIDHAIMSAPDGASFT